MEPQMTKVAANLCVGFRTNLYGHCGKSQTITPTYLNFNVILQLCIQKIQSHGFLRFRILKKISKAYNKHILMII